MISVLWLNAMVISALWIFNMVFGFNLFSTAHWQYLSELQLAGKVDARFYIFAAVSVVVSLAGLYMLIVPWHRKIRMRGGFVEIPARAAEAIASESTPAAISARPPKLNLNTVFIPTRREVAEMPDRTASRAVRDIPPARSSAPPAVLDKIKNMISNSGFVIKNAPAIGNIHLDFWAIGSDEALVAGLVCNESGEISAAEGGDSIWRANGREFKSPVWIMTSVVQKLQALFIEVVGPDLKINVLPFVFVNGGTVANKDSVRNIWDALGVKVFDDINVLDAFLNEYRPRQLDESEQADFGAFSEFIDSVAGYFNSGA